MQNELCIERLAIAEPALHRSLVGQGFLCLRVGELVHLAPIFVKGGRQFAVLR